VSHLVFVGLGFGGLYTLKRFLKHAPKGVRITAVDRRDRFVFTPLLYEYLAGELEPDVVAAPFEAILDDSGVERVMDEAERVDVEGRSVTLSGGREIPFDVLVLSPGSGPAYLGVTGAESHGLPFYSFEDAERLKATLEIRAWAQGSQPACVVGGGVVGVELAFALGEILKRQGRPASKGRVIVLEALDDILRGMSPDLRKAAKQKLEDAGVHVRTGVRVLRVDEQGVTFQNGNREERLDVSVVAWTAGIQPSRLLDALPAERQGTHGIRVDSTLQLPGHPHVFVIGDAISVPRGLDRPLPDTAQAAVQESETCANNVRRVLASDEPHGQFTFKSMGDFLRVGSGLALADVKGVVMDGHAGGAARRAAYLARLPTWATRLDAVRQWLG
jgi:demethylphylloquinone reductase